MEREVKKQEYFVVQFYIKLLNCSAANYSAFPKYFLLYRNVKRICVSYLHSQSLIPTLPPQLGAGHSFMAWMKEQPPQPARTSMILTSDFTRAYSLRPSQWSEEGAQSPPEKGSKNVNFLSPSSKFLQCFFFNQDIQGLFFVSEGQAVPSWDPRNMFQESPSAYFLGI